MVPIGTAWMAMPVRLGSGRGNIAGMGMPMALGVPVPVLVLQCHMGNLEQATNALDLAQRGLHSAGHPTMIFCAPVLKNHRRPAS
jgi:hypothetical protein